MNLNNRDDLDQILGRVTHKRPSIRRKRGVTYHTTNVTLSPDDLQRMAKLVKVLSEYHGVIISRALVFSEGLKALEGEVEAGAIRHTEDMVPAIERKLASRRGLGR